MGFLLLVCVRAALLLLCPFYNPVGVVLLSLLCVGSLYSLWSFTRFCAKQIFCVAEGHYLLRFSIIMMLYCLLGFSETVCCYNVRYL